jgi:hypothetical protein
MNSWDSAQRTTVGEGWEVVVRTQADVVQRRPFQGKLRGALAVALAVLLITAIAPLGPAEATNPDPWNEEGARWTGTIETQINYTYDYYDFYGEHLYSQSETATASYSMLTAKDDSCCGSRPATPVENAPVAEIYSGQIAASGTEDYTDTDLPECNWTGHWSVTEDARERKLGRQGLVNLVTDLDGQVFFWPYEYWIDDQYYSNGDCEGTPTISTGAHLGFEALGTGHGIHFAKDPLPDEDSNDPSHLVGQKTWTLADPPFPLGVEGATEYTQYSFAVTYDLRLVNDTRNLTLVLGRHLIAKGKLTSGGPSSCVARIPVKIQKRVSGNWKPIKTTNTTTTGRFKVKIKDKPGRYRAVVGVTVVDAQTTCLKTRSAPVVHRH